MSKILALDLRFYQNQSYGLAVYIHDLMQEMIPLLQQKKSTISQVKLIFHQSLKSKINQIKWLSELQQISQFELVFTNAKHYSLAEQTIFWWQIKQLKPDLIFFFTFNYPILYRGDFLYQILDLTHFKLAQQKNTDWKFKLKTKVANFIMITGLKNSKFNFIFGDQTQTDLENFLKIKPSAKSKIIWPGINPEYLKTKPKSQSISFQDKIQKPFFLFVSALKKHKNLPILLKAFEKLQTKNQDKFNLVVVGSKDPSNLADYQQMKKSQQFEQKNIIHLSGITNQELIALYDRALALIMPSSNEGFGLALAEAASRKTPVICSDIPIFHSILDKFAFYFQIHNGRAEQELFLTIQKFLKKTDTEIETKTESAKAWVKKFSWQTTAKQILQEIDRLI